MKKRNYLPVYSNAVHLDVLMLVFAMQICLIGFAMRNPENWCVWCIMLALNVIAWRFSWLVCIDTQGISVYRLFKKKLILRWSEVTYWGTVSKSLYGIKKVTYVYFSRVPLVSAPWEKLPPMSEEFLYLTSQRNLRIVLKHVGQKEIAVKLSNCTDCELTIFARRRLMGGTIITFTVFLFVLVLFGLKTLLFLPLAIFPAVNIIFILSSEM